MMGDDCLKNLVFPDDMVILSERKNELQLTVLTFNCRVFTKKTKIMAFKGKGRVWSKIVLEGVIRSAALHI